MSGGDRAEQMAPEQPEWITFINIAKRLAAKGKRGSEAARRDAHLVKFIRAFWRGEFDGVELRLHGTSMNRQVLYFGVPKGDTWTPDWLTCWSERHEGVPNFVGLAEMALDDYGTAWREGSLDALTIRPGDFIDWAERHGHRHPWAEPRAKQGVGRPSPHAQTMMDDFIALSRDGKLPAGATARADLLIERFVSRNQGKAPPSRKTVLGWFRNRPKSLRQTE